MSERLHHGRLDAGITDILDADLDVVPTFELAAIPVLDGAERPAEWPEVRRRFRAEGIRMRQHRGVILLRPGDLDLCASAGMFHGIDEVFLLAEWDDEPEPFPGRVSSDMHDFDEVTPIGLEEWVVDSGCVLVLGDGNGANFATLEPRVAARLRAQFRGARA